MALIMVIYGSKTPSRSRAEIEAQAGLPGIRSVRLPSGKIDGPRPSDSPTRYYGVWLK
jgi:hypothetical protein